MKLTVTTFVTLDGVMQGPGAPDEDRSNGFGLGGWLVKFVDEDFGEIVDGIFRRADEILLGRTTYEMMYAHWSQLADSEDVVAQSLNNLPKHIATSSVADPEWNNAKAISGDVVATVRELKDRRGRELQVHGSHGLIQTLLEAGLVDSFNVLIFPVVLGEGKRLFGDGTTPMTLNLISSRVTEAGVIAATYETSGEVAQQEFAIEDGKVVIR